MDIKSIPDQYRRLAGALVAARTFMAAVERMPEERPAGVSYEAHEAAWDAVIRAEREARDRLIDELRAALGRGDVALMLADGSVVTYSDTGDGLAIVPADRVRRLE